MDPLNQNRRLITRLFTRSTLFIAIIALSSGVNLLFTVYQLRNSSTREFADYTVTVSAIMLQSGMMGGLSVEVTRLLSSTELVQVNESGRTRSLDYYFFRTALTFLVLFIPTFFIAKVFLKLGNFDALVIPAFLVPSFFQAIYIGKLQARSRAITYALIGASTPIFMIILAILNVHILYSLQNWTWIYLVSAVLTTVIAKKCSEDIDLDVSTVFKWNLVKTSGFVFLTYWLLRIDIFTARRALGDFSGDRYISISSIATTIVGLSTLFGLFSIRSITAGDHPRRITLIKRLLLILLCIWLTVLISVAMFGPTISEYLPENSSFTKRSEYIPVFFAIAPYGIVIPLAFSVIGTHRTTITKLFFFVAIMLTVCLQIIDLSMMSYSFVYGFFGFVMLAVLINTTVNSTNLSESA